MILTVISLLINFIGLCSLIHLFTSAAEPIQDIKAWYNLDTNAEYKNPYQWFFVKLLNCNMCTGFWVGLFFYHTLPLAAITSLTSEALGRIISKL